MTNPAAVLMAYGSPDRLADVPAYYADIRGGRPIAPEHLNHLVARYRALGIDDSDGPSPLNAITDGVPELIDSGGDQSNCAPTAFAVPVRDGDVIVEGTGR